MMRPLAVVFSIAAVLGVLGAASCRTVPTGVSLERAAAGHMDASKACWGQATKVFARMGEMGEHASEQPNPRDGLRNLARYLYDEGVIEDDTMEALGKFVAEAYGLSIDACM